MLKRQQFKDNESDIMEPKTSKWLHVDEHDNKEKQGLDKYQGKDGKYVPLFLCSQKKSNRQTDLGEGTKRLNHLV